MQFEFPNIRHLHAFCEIAKHGGISAASKSVHLSQPAITQAIAKLESQLGVRLFDRLAGGMQTTRAGAVFLVRVQRMFAAITTGIDESTRRAGGSSRGTSGNFSQLVTATQLHALLALAEAKSFSIAARNTGISQPSIHRAGRGLEQLTGMTLFKTVRHGIELTRAADLLARRVGLAATELGQGYAEIAALTGRPTARIIVGSLPLARSWLLPKAIDSFLEKCPGVQIKTVDGPYPELLRGLRYGEIDFLIGALRTPNVTDDFLQEELFDDPLALVVRRGHPLSTRRHITLKDTLAYPWIAPPKSTPSGSYLYGVLDIAALETTPVKVVTSSLVLLRGLLLSGDYVTITSLHQIRHELDHDELIPLPIKLPKSRRPIGLTVRSDWLPTGIQKHFLQGIREISRNI